MVLANILTMNEHLCNMLETKESHLLRIYQRLWAIMGICVNRTLRAEKAPFVRWSDERLVNMDHVHLNILHRVLVSSCHLLILVQFQMQCVKTVEVTYQTNC